jgi:hypothetical protein
MIILSELVKAVLTDLHAESLFKTLVKAYRTLHTLVKYVSSAHISIFALLFTLKSFCI